MFSEVLSRPIAFRRAHPRGQRQTKIARELSAMVTSIIDELDRWFGATGSAAS